MQTWFRKKKKKRKRNAQIPKSVRRHKSTEVSVLLKPASSLVALTHLWWTRMKTDCRRAKLHSVWSRINSSVRSHNPRRCGIHKAPSPLPSPHLPPVWRSGLNLHKYESCFLTSKISFNPPSETHTHTQLNFQLLNSLSLPRELKNWQTPVNNSMHTK